MKNLKLGNIKENENYKLSKKMPLWITNGTFIGLLFGSLFAVSDACLGKTSDFKTIVTSLFIHTGAGAITGMVLAPVYHLTDKWIDKAKEKKKEKLLKK